MTSTFKKVIRCWRSIEELFIPIIDEKTSEPEKKVTFVSIDDRTTPWLDPENQLDCKNKYTYYYTISLGAIPVDTILDKIKELFSISRYGYNDNYSAKSRSCLASFNLNAKGQYESSKIDIPDYIISIAARIQYENEYDDIAKYSEQRERIKQDITDILRNTLTPDKVIQYEDMQDLGSDILDYVGWTHNSKIPIISSYAIICRNRIAKSKVDNELENGSKIFFNSNFARDLKKVEIDFNQNSNHPTICKYLSMDSSDKHDIRTTNYYQQNMIPQNIPITRWPNKGDKPLVLNQILAVKEALKTNDIFAINGPPGTGKTTLLKDIIANNIFNNARKISKLKNPDLLFTDKSFSYKDKDARSFKLWLLNEDFLDFITVVASSNNEAVENISRELPLSINLKWDIDYFNLVAQEIYGKKEAVGLFSAILGNKTNITNFFEKFWCDSKNKDGTIEIQSFKKVLQDHECTVTEWQLAKKQLEHKIQEYDNIISELADLNTFFQTELIIKQEISELESAYHNTQEKIEAIEAEIKLKTQQQKNCKDNVEEHNNSIKLKINSRPNILQIIIGLLKWQFPLQNWQNSINNLESERNEYVRERDKISKSLDIDNNTKSSLDKQLSLLEKKLEDLRTQNDQSESLKQKYHEIFEIEGLVLPDLKYWEQNNDILQSKSPWLYSKIQNIRAEIFVLSNRLIKCTILCNKDKLKNNLSIMNMMMRYGQLPEDTKQYALHVWNSFCLVVPIVSTTLASFSSLFSSLASRQISCLLLDEAGQAAPHKALGAIWRSKKVIFVGDPLQIEPVETLPVELGEQIMKVNNIDKKYNPLNSTAQSFADCANKLGTYISGLWIGFPLIVHRRCDNPMFTISNRISYDNLMLHHTRNKHSDLQSLFPNSLWLDIKGTFATDKWVHEEGMLVLDIINYIIRSLNILPFLFIISPFSNVTIQMKSLLTKSMIKKPHIDDNARKKWIKDSVGTVHSFQGKEADMVIIILGCDADAKSKPAINFATKKPNILNVALTRAKNLVFIIGNTEVWGTHNYFNILYQNIEVVDCEALQKKIKNYKTLHLI